MKKKQVDILHLGIETNDMEIIPGYEKDNSNETQEKSPETKKFIEAKVQLQMTGK